MALTEKLTAIADAIRGKTGKTETLTLDQMATAIESIETGGNDDAISESICNRTITEFSNENLTSVRQYFFYSCGDLQSVNLPNVTLLEDNVFALCSKLVSVNIPKLSTVWKGAFLWCTSLVFIDLVQTPVIGISVFYGDEALKYIVLRNTTSITTLQNTNSFDGTPYNTAGKVGYVLVPAALVSSYQEGTNWATMHATGTCVFLALEDYTVDGTTTGAIDLEKLYALEETT